ncbi:MAG: hypothetical protein WD066_16110 [Planctomycetaceae bacterium]
MRSILNSILMRTLGPIGAVLLAVAIVSPAEAQIGYTESARSLRSENFNRWPQYQNIGAREGGGYWQWHALRQGRSFHAPRSTSWESEWYLRRNWSEDPSGRRYRAREVEPPPATIDLPRRSTLQGTGTRSWW